MASINMTGLFLRLKFLPSCYFQCADSFSPPLSLSLAPPPVVDCGHPGSPPNGVLSGDKFTFGSTVRYSCLGGRQLKGESSRTCQLNGMWSAPMPFCSGKNAAPPTNRPGGGGVGRGQTLGCRRLAAHIALTPSPGA